MAPDCDLDGMTSTLYSHPSREALAASCVGASRFFDGGLRSLAVGCGNSSARKISRQSQLRAFVLIRETLQRWLREPKQFQQSWLISDVHRCGRFHRAARMSAPRRLSCGSSNHERTTATETLNCQTLLRPAQIHLRPRAELVTLSL